MAKYSLYVIKSLNVSMGSELPRFLKLDTAGQYQACKCNSCLSLATCEFPFTDMAGALVSIVVRVMISLYEIHPKISPAH